MSVLLDSWICCSVEELTSLIKDGTHGTHEDVEHGIPLLSAKDVREGVLSIPDDCRRISASDYGLIHKNYSIEAGDILLTVVGTIGRCFRLNGAEPRFTIQRSVAVLRPSGISPDYLYHYLRSEPFQVALRDSTNASAQGGVYLGALAKCLVKYPKCAAQQAKIAEILSIVDRAIAQTEAQISKQRRVKTGLMQDLLTRGIDEHNRVRSDRTHDFRNSPVGKIPTEWEVNTIEQLMKERIISEVQDGNHGELHPKSRPPCQHL